MNNSLQRIFKIKKKINSFEWFFSTKLEEELSIGEKKAKKIAQEKLAVVRKELGFA